VKKPYYHFIWPKDGQNGSKWGRAKDIFTGKGPDIHVTVSANKMDYMANRQRKCTWGNHLNLDDRLHDEEGLLQSPWPRLAGRGKRAGAGLRYDFETRTYRRTYSRMKTDAFWNEGISRKEYPFPAAWRNIEGEWLHQNPDAMANFFQVW
jgi:hypothetical protein